MIPIMLDLTNKHVVVIGGGNVAERKITSLLETESLITVVSPTITATLESYFTQGQIIWKKKNFASNDIKDAFLIITATNNPFVNQQVRDAAPKDVLINSADTAEEGNIHFPTYVKRGRLSIAISTEGASPSLAKEIKEKLELEYDENYETYLDFLYEARKIIKNSNRNNQDKRMYLKELTDKKFLNKQKQEEWITSFTRYKK
ncbi:NAD(P)-binding protein [Radiobacillus deserti]|uniref:precorrin-2 dehydrogenase n=1 Tax=Radiobacillus deserti TaxID=2594883 RepID=A0A516KDK2_9BACI|nr:NAD(P)-binding protein [Radiobacillus deserti]QDP39478.1 NAD(P)-binding protein [Radiobacillus deserti]